MLNDKRESFGELSCRRRPDEPVQRRYNECSPKEQQCSTTVRQQLFNDGSTTVRQRCSDCSSTVQQLRNSYANNCVQTEHGTSRRSGHQTHAHQVQRPSSAATIRRSDHQARRPSGAATIKLCSDHSGAATIRRSDHRARRPSGAATIKLGSDHQAQRPSGAETIGASSPSASPPLLLALSP